MKRLALAITALALVAAACGDDSSTKPTSTTDSAVSTTAPSPATTVASPPATVVSPIDPDQVVLTVRREGGLVPPEFLLGRLPLYTLYADGRLLYEPPTTAIFPGPLLPAVAQASIGTDGVSQVLVVVLATGLPNITELFNTDANRQVADGPNTEVTYFDENGEHFFSVYALMIADHTDPQVLRLAELITFLDQLVGTSPDGGEFEAERYQVIVSSQPPNTDDPLAVVEPWPLSSAPEEMAEFDFGLRCEVVNAADEPAAAAAFASAHQLTFFEHEGTPYRLTVRPLLLGEEGCETRDR